VSAGGSTVDLLLRATREGLLLALLLSAPPLAASLLVGFVVGMVQSAMQIHDQALAFVPKLVAVGLTVLVLGPVLASQLVRFTQALFLLVPALR
jgi:flagellar biosynthesis protein FliQ